MSVIVLAVVCVSVHVVRGTDCPSPPIRAIMERFTIDPDSFLIGKFVDVYFSPTIPNHPPVCSKGEFYLSHLDKEIHSKPWRNEDGTKETDLEVWRDGNIKGMYSVSGKPISGGMNMRYTGNAFVFHAERNSIGYYYCHLGNVRLPYAKLVISKKLGVDDPDSLERGRNKFRQLQEEIKAHLTSSTVKDADIKYELLDLLATDEKLCS